jgi:hypothetical protein
LLATIVPDGTENEILPFDFEPAPRRRGYQFVTQLAKEPSVERLTCE